MSPFSDLIPVAVAAIVGLVAVIGAYLRGSRDGKKKTEGKMKARDHERASDIRDRVIFANDLTKIS